MQGMAWIGWLAMKMEVMMAIDEFSFIHKYFANLNASFDGQARANGLDVGIGDDAALLKLDGTYAVTTDSLIEGVHFFPNFNPYLLGSRALEVNFSDVYAMGAQPQFITLALEVPERYIGLDEFWAPFSKGIEDALKRHQCALIGGNITKYSIKDAPLSMNITAFGKQAQPGRRLLRSQARVGDSIMVTGSVGGNGVYVEAGYAKTLSKLPEDVFTAFEKTAYSYDERMHRFIEVMVKYCDCGIDVSDGLLGDLSHILKHSHCTATLNCDALPLVELDESIKTALGLTDAKLLKHALTSGGDYNLLFTVSPDKRDAMLAELSTIPELASFKVSEIGTITDPEVLTGDAAGNSVTAPAQATENLLATDGSLIKLVDSKGNPYAVDIGNGSYNHFTAS